MNDRELGIQVKDKVKQSVREASSWLVWLGRFGYAVKGVIYILIGILAAYSAIGTHAANDGTRSALRHIVELPFGQFLLIAMAIGLASYALWQVIQAFMDTENKGSTVKGFAMRGFYAGIAFVYIGLAFSAVKIVLGARRGSGVWAQSWTAWLLAQPFGQWLVGFAGAMVIGVGFYQFYKVYIAKFRKHLILSEMSESEQFWATGFGRCGFAARG